MAQYCPMCKARLDGFYPEPEEGCQAVFERVLAREYSNPVYGQAHLVTVDCYALQHPEPRRLNSNAFHLLRLGWTINRYNFSRLGKTENDFKRYAYDLRQFPYLESPTDRGRVTVADITQADPEAHMKAVCAWAGSVWKAYEVHHCWVLKKLGIDL